MNCSDHDIDTAVGEALKAEVADVHADEDLLVRVRHGVVGGPAAGATTRHGVFATAAAVLLVVGAVGVATVSGGDDATPVVAGPPDEVRQTDDEAVVSVSEPDLGPLQVTTSALRDSDDGWKEHTISIEKHRRPDPLPLRAGHRRVPRKPGNPGDQRPMRLRG